MAQGPIIFLNGTTSAGKTSIARELLQILDAPYLHLPIDTFVAMRTPRDLGKQEGARVFAQIVSGFHHALAAMAGVGNNLIVDHVLVERPWLHECVHLLTPFDVVFVGVHCPLAELVRREQARGDRLLGQAAFQFERVHAHRLYDVECDTSTASVHQCVVQIKQVVEAPPTPRAFSQLRHLLDQERSNP
jgi:chloramphenicol 3-O phosphotransferase